MVLLASDVDDMTSTNLIAEHCTVTQCQ